METSIILLGILTCFAVYVVYKIYCNENEMKIDNGSVNMVQRSGDNSVQVQVAHVNNVNHVKQSTSIYIYSSTPPKDTDKLWINTNKNQIYFYDQTKKQWEECVCAAIYK